MVRNVVSLVVFLAIWQGLLVLFNVPGYLVPSPWALVQQAWFLTTQAGLFGHIPVTLAEIIIGLVIGVVAGVLFAMLFDRLPLIEMLLNPIIVLLQTAPKIAIAPLLLLWLGLDMTPKIVLVAIVSFFPILSNMLSSLRAMPNEMMELADILRLNPIQRMLRLKLPMALPMLFSGLKVAVTLAVTAAVIGELMGAKSGLGYLLSLGQETSDVELVLVTVFILSFIGYGLYLLVIEAERRMLSWHASAEAAAD